MISRKTTLILELVFIPLIVALLSLLIAFIEPQRDNFNQVLVGQTVLFCTLAFVLVVVIFALLIPPLNGIIIDYFKNHLHFYPVLVLYLLILPVINWFYSENILSAFTSFLLWYLLPTIIFIIPTYAPKFKFNFILQIIGVLLFAIGFDNRYTESTVSGFVSLGYAFNALWISSLILLLYSVQMKDYSEKMNWKSSLKKLLYPSVFSAGLVIISVPIGLATGFLTWSPSWPGIFMFIFSFIGIWLTIALPEELIARGVIQHQLTENIVDKEKNFYKYWKWIVLVVASIIFGVSHWNNTSLEFIWVYILLASIAGMAYGYSWWKGGLFSAMLLHTLVDWIWQLFFK
ncbi:MAG: CPBP family intramembrane metalloprotease [Candidatus Heimdallarchaeota archaeon]|nr:CPBP family intramembrane metalloprotease [Candidatus Heimdallarchaeota archaeon]